MLRSGNHMSKSYRPDWIHVKEKMSPYKNGRIRIKTEGFFFNKKKMVSTDTLEFMTVLCEHFMDSK